MPGMASESLLPFVRGYAARGDEIAVRQRRGYRMESWSYRRIAEESNRVARELEARGLRKGDAVLLWGTSSAEWIIAFLGCLVSGVVVVPVDEGSTPAFADQVVREVGAKILFCSAAHRERPEIPAIELESLCEAVGRRDGSAFPSPALTRQDTLEIIFTSGTTAEPRGVAISHGNVLANIEPLQGEIEKYLRYERLVHPLRFLNTLPLSHVFGQMLGIFIPPMLAATVVFYDSFKPLDIFEAIRRERVSVLISVPRLIESLRREVERQVEQDGRTKAFEKAFAESEHEHFLRRWWRFRRIRSQLGWKFWAFISGGAYLPQTTEKFWHRLGFAVIQGYGMTETTSLISLNHPFHTAQGSIGKIFPGVEVRVAENGEILVRGENVASAYRSHGETRSVAESDGWFRTGDIAEKDEAGQLYFKGRSKNVIVTSAGMNVYPEDLEKALRGKSGVRDCVVVGLEKHGNEEPCAVLLMEGQGSEVASAAVQAANQTLPEYQRMRQWYIWPENDFPRTPTQKPILPRIRTAVREAMTGTAPVDTSEESVAGLISKITGRAAEPSSTDANLETNLRLSSLDRVELLSVLEQRHQVNLNETEFQGATTVGQIEELLAHGTASPVRHVYPTWPQTRLATLFRMAVYYTLAWPATYLMAAPRVRGRANLKDVHGPVLVVSNHVTYLDIAWILPALPARFRNRLATAMRGERLAEMRRPARGLHWFERFMERLRYVLVVSLFNVFPLPKESGFLQSFHFAGNLADRKWNILVFPEGLTTETGEMVAFRSGIGLLAKQLNLPVVPVRLDGLYELKRDRRLLAWPGTVRVTIGQVLRFGPNQAPEAIAKELECRVRELQPD